MFKRKKKKAGCETPEYSRFSMAPEPKAAVKPNPNYIPPATIPPLPPVKQKQDIDTAKHGIAIKNIDSIIIKYEKDKMQTFIELDGIGDAKEPIMNIQSDKIDYVSFGETVLTKELSIRDAFVPGATMCLTGTFEDLDNGRLFYGEYDILNYKLKEILL